MTALPPTATNRRSAARLLLFGGWLNLGLVTVQGIVLVPLYLRFIGSGLYGAWLGSGDILGWLSLLDLGIGSLMTQRIARAIAARRPDEVGGYLASGGVMLVLIALVIVTVSAIAAPVVPSLMEISGAEADVLASCFILAAASVALSVLSNGLSSLALALQKPAVPTFGTTAGTFVGIGAIVWLLFEGLGLWALAIGLVARSSTILLINLAHVLSLIKQPVVGALRPRKAAFRDMRNIAGPAVLSQTGAAVAMRSEAALIAIFLRPELATAYVLTRRAGEIAAMVLDRLGGATFPGFAQVSSEDKERARRVLSEIMHVFAAVAVALLTLYMALNRSFVNLWVGADFFVGQGLTALLALGMLLTTRSTVTCYLYGGAGQIRDSAMLTFGSAISRIVLMPVLLSLIGLVGLPVAAILSSAPFSEIALHRLSRHLGGAKPPAILAEFGAAHAVLLLAGGLVGAFLLLSSWTAFLFIGSLAAAAVFAGLVIGDPPLKNRTLGMIARVRTRRSGHQ